MIRVCAVLMTVLLWGAAVAQAQPSNILAPGQPITVAWDPPENTTDANRPTGYRFETFVETANSVVITTTDVPATPTQATLPASVLPPNETFLLAIRAFNAQGVSGRSNALPFVRAAVPPTPGNLRVVPAP